MKNLITTTTLVVLALMLSGPAVAADPQTFDVDAPKETRLSLKADMPAAPSQSAPSADYTKTDKNKPERETFREEDVDWNDTILLFGSWYEFFQWIDSKFIGGLDLPW